MAPKKQQQKMALGDFLNDQTLGSWADEMDNAPLPMSTYSSSRAAPSGAGSSFGAGGFGADRPKPAYAVREQLPMPSRPPYTAHLGNLSFEVTEADVRNFLSGCECTSVRIVEDKMDQRPKGFGYVEFATVDGLKKALDLNESSFQGRNIRISIADPPKNDREPMREITDWTRKGPLPDLPNAGGSMRRGMGERSGSFRGGPEGAADAKPRDFGNWERRGPLASEPRTERAPREERRASPSWGEASQQRTEGSVRGDRAPRPERVPTAADMDSKWRSKMRPDAPEPAAASPDASTPTSPSAPSAPAQRPRLNLAKRTVSEAPTDSNTSSDSKASPFGAARPIDTSAREKEIEEKRLIAIREKKEQDDKARDEKRAKETASRETAAKETADKAEKTAAKKDDDQEESAAPKDKQYEILRRMDEGDEADPEGVDADAQGTIIDDKQVKPQEPVVEVKKGGDSWRKSEQPQTTAETMEDEGWSTVSSKQKSSRKGGQRAMAS